MAEFNERKHPRDDIGRFTKGGAKEFRQNTSYEEILRVSNYSEKAYDFAEKGKEFQDVKSARQFFKDISEGWQNSLSNTEKKGIKEYTDYRSYNINADLRNGKYNTSKWKKQIDEMDKAISKFDLSSDIKVYRGTNIMEFGKTFNDFSDIKALEGKNIELPSYTSTSTNYKVADKEFDGEILMQIEVKKGRGKGAYVDYLSYINPDNEEDRESEFLLKRNSQLKIKKVLQRYDGKIMIEAEV